LAGVWAREASKKNWDPLLISATVEASNFKFGTQLGFGTSLPKNNVLDQNWPGLGQGSIRKNVEPLRISATVEANWLSKKQHLIPKLEGVWARGTSKKILGPPIISAIVEGSNFKFGTQLRFGTTFPKNNV